jgi:hypothetical protein
VFDEVTLSSNQISEKRLRVDLLAVPKDGSGRVLGFEVKRGFYRMSEYAQAIKQAADYRLGWITDPRLPRLENHRISASFVFPRWNGGHDNPQEYGAQAPGMEILSHHFRVGVAQYEEGSIALLINDQMLWSSGSWSGNAAGVLGGKERIGSSMSADPARLRGI